MTCKHSYPDIPPSAEEGGQGPALSGCRSPSPLFFWGSIALRLHRYYWFKIIVTHTRCDTYLCLSLNSERSPCGPVWLNQASWYYLHSTQGKDALSAKFVAGIPGAGGTRYSPGQEQEVNIKITKNIRIRYRLSSNSRQSPGLALEEADIAVVTKAVGFALRSPRVSPCRFPGALQST